MRAGSWAIFVDRSRRRPQAPASEQARRRADADADRSPARRARSRPRPGGSPRPDPPPRSPRPRLRFGRRRPGRGARLRRRRRPAARRPAPAPGRALPARPRPCRACATPPPPRARYSRRRSPPPAERPEARRAARRRRRGCAPCEPSRSCGQASGAGPPADRSKRVEGPCSSRERTHRASIRLAHAWRDHLALALTERGRTVRRLRNSLLAARCPLKAAGAQGQIGLGRASRRLRRSPSGGARSRPRDASPVRTIKTSDGSEGHGLVYRRGKSEDKGGGLVSSYGRARKKACREGRWDRGGAGPAGVAAPADAAGAGRIPAPARTRFALVRVEGDFAFSSGRPMAGDTAGAAHVASAGCFAIRRSG